MKKVIFMVVSSLFVFWLVCLFSYDKNLLANTLNIPRAQAVASSTQAVAVSVNVIDYLSFTFSAGSTILLGDLVPQTPNCHATGTVFLVSTNASNGYKMTPSDGSDTSSALVHADAATYIKDYLGTTTAPTIWTGSGLGLTLWSGVQKEAKWGTGTTACDAFNKWAGTPANSSAVSGHIVTGFLSGPDTTYWNYKIDVPNTQKTGIYTGNITFTVVNVLS